MIANCGSDENGKYSGGSAGDQTGKEYCIRSWYNRPWNCILRYPDKKVGEKIAKIARSAAQNNCIGYDQSQRLTFYTALKAAGWDVSTIKKKCEADCSSSTAAVIIATGYKMNLSKLQKISPSCTTWSLRGALKTAGFRVLTESKYLTSDDYLLPGDVLLNDEHHVTINLDAGANAENKTSNNKDAPELAQPTLKKGDNGAQVKYLQKDLNYILKSKLSVDGDFGEKTETAMKTFQKKYKLTVDGIYGAKSKLKMKDLLV